MNCMTKEQFEREKNYQVLSSIISSWLKKGDNNRERVQENQHQISGKILPYNWHFKLAKLLDFMGIVR